MSYDNPPPPPPPPAQSPPPGYGMPMGPAPKNWLVESILATIFCCLPLGVVGIVFAAQVNSKWQAGDAAGANDASQKAKNFTLASVGIGVVGVLFYVVFILMLGAASA